MDWLSLQLGIAIGVLISLLVFTIVVWRVSSRKWTAE